MALSFLEKQIDNIMAQNQTKIYGKYDANHGQEHFSKLVRKTNRKSTPPAAEVIFLLTLETDKLQKYGVIVCFIVYNHAYSLHHPFP